jgi:hypothetical protein
MTGEFEQLFGPGKEKITEEQLYATNVLHILTNQNPEAAEKFVRKFKHEMRENKGEQNRIETSVASSLEALVKTGALSRERAEKINGRAFEGAQLDDKKGSLYDGSGNTKAVAALDVAFGKALEALSHRQSKPRELVAPKGHAYRA